MAAAREKAEQALEACGLTKEMADKIIQAKGIDHATKEPVDAVITYWTTLDIHPMTPMHWTDVLAGRTRLGFQDEYCKLPEPKRVKYGHRSTIQLGSDLAGVLHSRAKSG